MRGVVVVGAVAAVVGALVALEVRIVHRHSVGLEGRTPRVQPWNGPTVRAAFTRESYRPGDLARLAIRSEAADARVQILRAGTERSPLRHPDVMLGDPVGRSRVLGTIHAGQSVAFRVREWRSGLYVARLRARGRKVGYAPFVVRPRALGEARVAVVLPTQTWQAYNFSDDDGDGDEDSWYAGSVFVRTGRPYENRGVPTNYRRYDQPFLRWLSETGRNVDFFAQADLNQGLDGRSLARAYDLIIFPGHHEYVTRFEYETVEAFRNAGGNLMFLSANNFFWRVVRRGNVMRRARQWRALGRPESALIGVQYFASDRGSHKRPWVVRDASSAGGLLASVGLQRGNRFGEGGVEVDAITRHSPPKIKVLAELGWRRGRRAQMTYYETWNGAKVFAAGAFSLVLNLHRHDGRELLDELWERLARP